MTIGGIVMKYVRTEDGIWGITEIKPNYEKTYYHCKHNLIGNRFEKMDIIKQADAIDELIDGLIVEEKGNPNNWFTMEVYDFKNEEEHLKGWTYRAFIKTDKGLIYVAEMNEEGKLKLL